MKGFWAHCCFLLIFGSYTASAIEQETPWVILVYMAADNDLHPFADRNLEQMKQIGSTENLIILVVLTINKPGARKVTRRLIVERGKVRQCGPDMCLDSGSEQTLIDSLSWAMREFPSKYFGLVMWNHGSGDLNPLMGRAINPAQLFVYNPETRLIELDRSVGFFEFIDEMLRIQDDARGVCFDETSRNYLDDRKLKFALEAAIRPIDVIMFDACLMAGIGTAWLSHTACRYLVASEEVELGTGYNYSLVLAPLAQRVLTPREFAIHVVEAFKATYGRITRDYTHSAIDLHIVPQLKIAIDMLAISLKRALDIQKNGTVKTTLRHCRSRLHCTHFEEPNYIGMHHFLRNLLQNCDKMEAVTAEATRVMRAEIRTAANDVLSALSQAVIANVAGDNLKNAGGLYFYFPEKNLHASYIHTEFAKNSSWPSFLQTYIAH